VPPWRRHTRTDPGATYTCPLTFLSFFQALGFQVVRATHTVVCDISLTVSSAHTMSKCCRGDTGVTGALGLAMCSQAVDQARTHLSIMARTLPSSPPRQVANSYSNIS
jgi:hypothetical protein